MKTIAFFNNKGGVGKTSLVYHLAWMFAELGVDVIAADLDPQANLSSIFLDEERLEELWANGDQRETILGVIRPILRGIGDIQQPHLERVSSSISLIVGDLGLSGFEDKLSDAWPRCHDADESAFRTITGFYRALLLASRQAGSDLVLVDVGPNLGAINRAAILSADHVVIPLAPDLYSLQGLTNLGPTLRSWRGQWAERNVKNPDSDLPIPSGKMDPAGYVVMQHAIRSDRPVKAYDKWIERIPTEYRKSVTDEKPRRFADIRKDAHCLALLKHYRSLMPMAMEARKPMFMLRPADGAIGGHVNAVHDCYSDFNKLAQRIAARCGISLP